MKKGYEIKFIFKSGPNAYGVAYEWFPANSFKEVKEDADEILGLLYEDIAVLSIKEEAPLWLG